MGRLTLAATALALVPLALLIGDAVTGGLGVEPIETVTHRTGWWALTLLLATLTVTPLRRITGWNRLIEVRKPLGLSAFLYVSLHFTTYVALDQWFAISYIIEDIAERPYITVGFTAFLLLIPLAATSTRGAIRRLGGRKWQRLHRLIYPAAVLGVLHFFWLVKADTREPLTFAAVLAVLLLMRVPAVSRSLRPRRANPRG